MNELGDVVKALLVLDLVVGNLYDIVAHAGERGGAFGIGEACGFAIVAERPWHSKMTPMLSVALSMRISA